MRMSQSPPINNSPLPRKCPLPSGCIRTEVVAIFISTIVVNRETVAFVIALPVLIATRLTVKLLVPICLRLTSTVSWDELLSRTDGGAPQGRGRGHRLLKGRQ